MINVSEARKNDENFKNSVDLLFDALEETDHFPEFDSYKNVIIIKWA